ncbi:hypothetical protein [Candidatus Phytoplasma phoenicium]|uniref:hypothetical protein n=1 Tax=Candidatus Phytoplasma phoenicium TaxID=198422 RepID=UPI000A4A3B30|nr:hypothetical protein [Candidatus Phytoplasma phoenicium]
MALTTPLYFKISIHYETNQTIINPEQYFSLSFKVNDQKYEDTHRPLMTLENGIGTMKI